MKTDDVFRVNSPRVIFENIDGELILVHMERGAYYTTDEVGAELWGLIEARCNVSDMCDVLRSRYDADAEMIEHAVAAFLGRLAEEDLVSNGDEAGVGTRPDCAPSEPKRPFRPPVLQAFRDMQDMLSLDPIHDVEAAGWPVPKAESDPPPATRLA
jgi:coenzyme PQQ synthesis protein D (PqqD)